MSATASDYQRILSHETCPKMRRAWRNRSNVTHDQWVRYAKQLLPSPAVNTLGDCYRLAACLYVACGWYAARCGSETFSGSNIPPQGFELIRVMTEDFLTNTPDRALTRLAWEEQRKENAIIRRHLRKQLWKLTHPNLTNPFDFSK